MPKATIDELMNILMDVELDCMDLKSRIHNIKIKEYFEKILNDISYLKEATLDLEKFVQLKKLNDSMDTIN